MHKTPVKNNKYETYKSNSKAHLSSSKPKTASKIARPCHFLSDLIKETPKIKDKFLNTSQHKII